MLLRRLYLVRLIGAAFELFGHLLESVFDIAKGIARLSKEIADHKGSARQLLWSQNQKRHHHDEDKFRPA